MTEQIAAPQNGTPKAHSWAKALIHVVSVFYKWFFDLFKNMVATGVLYYIGKKSDNKTVEFVSYIALLVLCLNCVTYWGDVWMDKPFNFVKEKYLRAFLNYSFGIILGLLAPIAAAFFITYAVSSIAAVQGAK